MARPKHTTPELPQERLLLRRVRWSFGLMAVAAVIGTIGYREEWHSRGGTWVDALYMTVITMTTIGYGEVHPLDTPGRLLTIWVALTGVGSLFTLLSAGLELLIVRAGAHAGERRMEHQISELSGHVIVAGMGRVGRQAALALLEAGQAVVAVDPSDKALEFAAANSMLSIRGDCTSDEVLSRAGIDRASGLVVTTDSDANNLYVVISARLLNPKLRIVARAVDEESAPKLRRAGADRAISPYAIGGRRLAHLIASPNVVDFLDTALTHGASEVQLEEVELPGTSALVGAPLSALRRAEGDATVLVLLRKGGPVLTPPADTVLGAGDRLLVMGTADQLAQLQRRVATPR